jgi:ribonuclease P/MRP protein subunit POP1
MFQAITPTEKSYRPSHRAATRGVIVSDVSYFGTIELRGPQATLITILHRVLHPDGHGPGAKR